MIAALLLFEAAYDLFDRREAPLRQVMRVVSACDLSMSGREAPQDITGTAPLRVLDAGDNRSHEARRMSRDIVGTGSDTAHGRRPSGCRGRHHERSPCLMMERG